MYIQRAIEISHQLIYKYTNSLCDWYLDNVEELLYYFVLVDHMTIGVSLYMQFLGKSEILFVEFVCRTQKTGSYVWLLGQGSDQN